MVEETRSRTNHTFYKKINFNEFVANVLHDNMGMISFVESVRDQKQHISWHTLALSVHLSAPVLLTQDSSRYEIRSEFQPPFSLHMSNSITKPAGLDFKDYISRVKID